MALTMSLSHFGGVVVVKIFVSFDQTLTLKSALEKILLFSVVG